jgi:ribosomal protein S18 acetylase RimI-like enzyme
MEVVLRKANIDDVELLIKLRIDYLTEDKGSPSQYEETAIRNQLEEYFSKHIPNNTFIGIFAEANGKIASTAYLAVSEKPANQVFITGVTGTILNVLTYPEHRRKGFATKVLERLINEAKTIGVSYIDLSATSDGIYLYEKMGFKKSKYIAMNLLLICPD